MFKKRKVSKKKEKRRYLTVDDLNFDHEYLDLMEKYSIGIKFKVFLNGLDKYHIESKRFLIKLLKNHISKIKRTILENFAKENFESINAKKTSKAELVQIIIGRIFGEEPGKKKRTIELENMKNFNEEDLQFEFCDVEIPPELIRYIFSFLPFDKLTLDNVGCINSIFYLYMMCNWFKHSNLTLTISNETIQKIPVIALNGIKKLKIKELNKDNISYLLEQIEPNRIVKTDFSDVSKISVLKTFFSQCKKKKVTFDKCEKLIFPCSLIKGAPAQRKKRLKQLNKSNLSPFEYFPNVKEFSLLTLFLINMKGIESVERIGLGLYRFRSNEEAEQLSEIIELIFSKCKIKELIFIACNTEYSFSSNNCYDYSNIFDEVLKKVEKSFDFKQVEKLKIKHTHNKNAIVLNNLLGQLSNQGFLFKSVVLKEGKNQKPFYFSNTIKELKFNYPFHLFQSFGAEVPFCSCISNHIKHGIKEINVSLSVDEVRKFFKIYQKCEMDTIDFRLYQNDFSYDENNSDYVFAKGEIFSSFIENMFNFYKNGKVKKLRVTIPLVFFLIHSKVSHSFIFEMEKDVLKIEINNYLVSNYFEIQKRSEIRGYSAKNEDFIEFITTPMDCLVENVVDFHFTNFSKICIDYNYITFSRATKSFKFDFDKQINKLIQRIGKFENSFKKVNKERKIRLFDTKECLDNELELYKWVCKFKKD